MSVFDKSRVLVSFSIQVVLVVITFAIMCVFSFMFVSQVERRHLVKDAENTLAVSEIRITDTLLEAENFLNGYAQTVRSMARRGASREEISFFFSNVLNFIMDDKNENARLVGLFGARGFFHYLGGIYISGSAHTPSEDFNPQETIWYKDAIAAGGEVAASGPYRDPLTGTNVITFSRFLLDDDGTPLGVACLGLELQNIYKYALDISLTKSSYGMLLDKNLQILAHPHHDFVGTQLNEAESGIANLAGALEQGLSVNEHKERNYRNESSIVFFKPMNYNLYLGIVIPVNEYYRSVYGMAVFLVLLGGILAAALCFMLYRIAQTKKKLDLHVQQKNNFLAAMSHEIRTPLNAILGITEIQMRSGASSSSSGEQFVKINNYGNLLLGIIDDILDLSKIESGKLELTPIKYDVASLINDVVQLTSIRYENSPLEFKIEVDEDIPTELVGDELQIKQILNHLLSNAFKYTEQGTVTLAINAEVVSRGGTALVTLVFKIIDTGQGMTSKQIDKLFDEHTRINMEADRTTSGIGFGLTITRHLVSLMQGKIEIKSEVGKGTEVTVRIPQKTDSKGIGGFIGKKLAENLKDFKPGDAAQIKKVQIFYEYMPYGSVLIVDDVESNLYVAKGLMAPYGLKIETAASGFEAIDKIKAGNTYDVVFMDHMMPKMDGIETVKRLRETGYLKPIVALTANALAGHEEMFLKNSFDGFIAKPIDTRHLDFLLNKLIRDKQPAEVLEAAALAKSKIEQKQTAEQDFSQIEPELAMFFVRDAEKACVSLETILKNNFKTESDVQLYVVNVHAMKSALANIGRTELSSVALGLERAGREKDIDFIASETNKFINDLQVVINEVKPKDEDEDIEDSKEALLFLREKLTIIKDACVVFDKKTVKNTLNELKEKAWSKKTKELMNSIADHLLHSEFDEVADIADSYIQTIG